jgi:hypothetical protein
MSERLLAVPGLKNFDWVSRTINVVDTDTKGLVTSRAEWVDIMAFETFPVYPFGFGTIAVRW